MTQSLLRFLLQCLPPETAHRLAVKGLGLVPQYSPPEIHLGLGVEMAGLFLPHPIGLAAGFDKNAEAIIGAANLGFALIEVGTITPKPQFGNPKPRVFRLADDKAIINRYGFNNDGMVKAGQRLAAYRQRSGDRKAVIGVNIGANKDSTDRPRDYFLTAKHLAQYADYIAVNVSSPNTPNLRGLQEPQLLKEVLDAAQQGMDEAVARRPLMLKISPDLDRDGLYAALDVALKSQCQGVIISNTTIGRPDDLSSVHKTQAGGLSGRPLFKRSSEMLAIAHAHLIAANAQDPLPIIAAGGVDDAKTAYVKILLGASLVQIYTGLVFKGAGLASQIVQGLGELLERDGVKTLTEIRGSCSSLNDAIRQAED